MKIFVVQCDSGSSLCLILDLMKQQTASRKMLMQVKYMKIDIRSSILCNLTNDSKEFTSVDMSKTIYFKYERY